MEVIMKITKRIENDDNKEDFSSLIVKSNSLTEAYILNMNKNEYKLILFLISKIKKEDKSFRKISMSVSEYNELLNIKGTKTYNYMKNLESSLLHKSIRLKSTDEKGNIDYIAVNWFSFVKYRDSKIEICFNYDLSPHLLRIDTCFTKYLLKNISNLSSFYSIRIYELLKQYQKIGKREIFLSELKQMVGANYDRYNHFKTKVLEVAKKDLNNNSDISFEYEEIKKGRKVYLIKFLVRQNDLNVDEIEIKEIIKVFSEKTKNELDYKRLAELISAKGLGVVKYYVENFEKFLESTNIRYPANFFYDVVKNESPIPSRNKINYNKPEQSSNFEQRIYDDEFFDSLYDNLK
jgi:plasmid replication initiation protein